VNSDLYYEYFFVRLHSSSEGQTAEIDDEQDNNKHNTKKPDIFNFM